MTEVVETKGNAVSTNVVNGIADQFSSEDTQQGRLMVMQSNSTFVKEESARAGALVNIIDQEEFAYKGSKNEDAKDLEFMIAGILKYWVVKDSDGNFMEKFPAKSPNELKWEENVNGVDLKRVYHFSYIILPVEEIEQGIEQPYELAFRSTGVKDTKKLNSIINKLAVKGVSSNERVFKAKVVEKADKTGKTWWGLDLSLSREANENEVATCTEYYQNFLESKAKFMDNQDAYAKAEHNTVEDSDY